MAELKNFNLECLYVHNELRKFHNVNPLQYNKNLSIQAQKYAEIIAKNDKMEHSKTKNRDNAGENLALCMRPFTDFKYSGLGASVKWYSEIKDYDFTKETQSPGNPATGHFTQLIWKDSTEAGFGRAMNKKSKTWYIVGRYQPPGNYLGEYKGKVMPLSKRQKWDTIPIVKEYLRELQTIEYTKARKHILDKWDAEIITKTRNGVPYSYEVTETFTTPNGSTYSENVSFSKDPSKMPRPIFRLSLNDTGNNQTKYRNKTEKLKTNPKEKSKSCCLL